MIGSLPPRVLCWLLFAGVMVTLVAIQLPAATFADSPVLVDSLGDWPMQRLGYNGVDIPMQGQRHVASIQYQLPPDATQGGKTWYMVRLHLTIDFSKDTGHGIALVSADTNGRTAAQMSFETRPQSEGLTVRRKSIDLVDGTRTDDISSNMVEGMQSNYLQSTGVQAGTNTLAFQVEMFGDIIVNDVHIAEDSGIQLTALSPARIRLNANSEGQHVRVGDSFKVNFSVSNDGDSMAKNIIVRAEYPQDSMETVGPSEDRMVQLGKGSRKGTLTLRALKAGRQSIVLQATSSANRPAAVVDVYVNNTGSLIYRLSTAARWMIPGISMLCLVGFAVRRGRGRQKERIHRGRQGCRLIYDNRSTA